MSSESPGGILSSSSLTTRNPRQSNCPTTNASDETQCLFNANDPATATDSGLDVDGEYVLQKDKTCDSSSSEALSLSHFFKQITSESRGGLVIRTLGGGGHISFLPLLLLILLLPLVTPEGFCDPLLCTCHAHSANCSSRGFLSLPASLQEDLVDLDLSNNDIQGVNQTEMKLYNNLENLDISHNDISLLESGDNYKLIKLDLSHNKISTLRRIQLAKFHAIKHLDLSFNQITSIPTAIFAPKSSLQFLNLASNSVEILEPGCFHDLVSLEELKLNRNKISSFPKEIFINLQNLRILELNKNKLVEVPGLSFHGLKNVKILKLKRNNLRFLMDGAFYGLESIEQLYLDRNEVLQVNKGWLYGLTKLKQLSLAYNSVDYIHDDGWDFCRELYELNLQGNQLKIVERDILRRLPSLTHLNLRDNLISHVDSEDTFHEVPLLEQLLLDGNQISHTVEDTAAPFSNLKKLRVLGLARNSIKSVGNQALLGLEALEQLDLSNNVISTVEENPIQHLPLLSSLLLNSSSLLCDCNLRWLPLYLNMTGVTGVTAKCAHPENLKGKQVGSIHSELFTCEDFPKPYILVPPPETQIALRGDDLTLGCRAASTSPAPMNFIWKKDGVVLELFAECDADNSCIKNIAHSFDGKGMEITSELRLRNMTHEDNGDYQCIVDNVYGATYSNKARITVYVFPQFVLTPTDKTVQGGASVSLKCSATGVPQPDISWQKDSGRDFPAATQKRLQLDLETNTYTILGVRAEDMGVYTCTATNLAGAVTTNISLNVLEVPMFVKPMSDKTAQLGETALLECISRGSPRPSLAWRKDGGPLSATERHFFTADNQLLIIVKVEARDEGRYQCEMANQLGVTRGVSYLTVKGGPGQKSDPTTGIIVIAVVCCVLGTSLVWVLIIYQTRRRARARSDDYERKLPTTLTGLPLLAPEEECGSERDSGTGDSKRSYDQTENNIVDHVIHNFLSARGDTVKDWAVVGANMTSLSSSDLDTGISSMGDQQPQSLHRQGCPKLKPPPTVEEVVVRLTVDNPLYSSLPVTQQDVVEEADSPRPPSHNSSAVTPPASVISDSVAYCGRFPAQDQASCNQCGEELARCVHHDTVSSVASVSSCGQSSVPSSSATTSDNQAITFNTFHPFLRTNHDRQPAPMTPPIISPTSPTTEPLLAGLSNLANSKGGKKRLSSTIELPTGETYLAIEQARQETHTLLEDGGAREYRGGAGTLPRHGLQQEWLEASLNCSDSSGGSLVRPDKDRNSARRKSSMFRKSKRFSMEKNGSLPRRKSMAKEAKNDAEHSDVVNKDKDMF